MNALADYITYRIWGAMLWLMRRDWMRRLQQIAPNLLPLEKRATMRLRIRRQDAFALKYGRRILKVSVLALLASLSLTTTYEVLLYLSDKGFLTRPDFLNH